MKDLQLAKEEESITRKVKNISVGLLKIMECSENSEKFNAIFKKKSLPDGYNALQLLPSVSPPLLNHIA